MNLKRLALTIYLAGLGPQAAYAITALPPEWGTLATISTSPCPDICSPDDIFLLGSLTVDPVDGGENQGSATVSTGVLPAAGSAFASAMVDGSLAVPILKTGAASSAGQWIAGQALGIQGYQFTGQSADTLTLSYSLSGTIANPDNDTATGLVAIVSLFAVDALTFPTLDTTNPLALMGSLIAQGILAEDSDAYEITTTGNVSVPGSVSINLNPGDQFYVMMALMAGAGGTNASALSLNTLSASFEPGAEALLLPSNPVPLPAAIWLLAPALGILGARSRSKR